MKFSFKQTIAISVTAAVLSGCTATQQPPVGEKTQQGAAIGALAGAILGAATGSGNKAKRAAIGALAGAALGSAVGYNMDQQATAVAQSLQTNVSDSPEAEKDLDRDIIVTKTEQYVKITFRDDMMFATNFDTPTAMAELKLKKLIPVLRDYPSTIIQVVGHTDNRGTYEYNKKLSDKRAANVANMLLDSGLPNRIYARGCSFSKPIVSNTSKENMGINRRVEVFLYPSEDVVTDQCM